MNHYMVIKYNPIIIVVNEENNHTIIVLINH